MTNHKLREKINSLNLNINQDKKIIEKNQPQLGIDIITAITTDYSDGEEKVKESLILAFDSKKHPVMLVDSRNVDSINDKSK
ncbi:hypothetical protein GW750_09200 [bacterium]|nr:hypothetical protein [bacterium]